MKYRMTICPAMEETNKSKMFLFETIEQMMAAKDTTDDLLLFLQDDLSVMPDYSNCFLLEEKIGGAWEEYDDTFDS